MVLLIISKIVLKSWPPTYYFGLQSDPEVLEEILQINSNIIVQNKPITNATCITTGI